MLPGITFHLDAGYLELDAQVIGNGTDWLELIACTPGSREHEALVTVTAKPSDLHFALLALGIEPGRTQRGVRTDAGLTLTPATGAPVFLDFIVPSADNVAPPVVVPVGAWVIDRTTGQPLNDRAWMFTGSQLIDDRGTPIYLADVNGTVASLVHFGDETLGRDTTLTQDADGQNLAAHPTALPPNGTPLRLRITPRKSPPPPEAPLKTPRAPGRTTP